MEQKSFTLSIFTEDQVGLLQRITTIFTQRHINIESLTTSETEVDGIFRFIVVVKSTEEKAVKLRKQLDKLIGVIKSFVLNEEDVVMQEIALYKLSTSKLNDGNFEQIIRQNNARVLSIDPDYIMIEKTGHPGETLDLFHKLAHLGVQGFSRSGVIAISKKPLKLKSYLAM